VRKLDDKNDNPATPCVREAKVRRRARFVAVVASVFKTPWPRPAEIGPRNPEVNALVVSQFEIGRR
jgi:hypothetical protein